MVFGAETRNLFNSKKLYMSYKKISQDNKKIKLLILF